MSCGRQFLLNIVERHLARTGISPSRFGRMIAGDPRLVFDMRRGRQINEELEERLLSITQSRDVELLQ